MFCVSVSIHYNSYVSTIKVSRFWQQFRQIVKQNCKVRHRVSDNEVCFLNWLWKIEICTSDFVWRWFWNTKITYIYFKALQPVFVKCFYIWLAYFYLSESIKKHTSVWDTLYVTAHCLLTENYADQDREVATGSSMWDFCTFYKYNTSFLCEMTLIWHKE